MVITGNAVKRQVDEELHRLKGHRKYTEFAKVSSLADFHKVCKNVCCMPNRRVVFTPGITRNTVNSNFAGSWVAHVKTESGKSLRFCYCDSLFGGDYWLSLREALVAVRENSKFKRDDLIQKGLQSAFSNRLQVSRDRYELNYKVLLANGTNMSIKDRKSSWTLEQATERLIAVQKAYLTSVIETLDMSISILDIGHEKFTNYVEWQNGKPIIALE